MSLRWMLFDLNSYFASCEQQEDPTIRGKPVIVVPTLADSTSVIASSYEARKFGIKTGTRVGDAKKMCPQVIIRHGNHKIYTEYHHKIIAAVNEIIPIDKVLSIDEVACKLMGSQQTFAAAEHLAKKLKAHVKHKVGSEINSSVGIGPNILLAKIASDMQKPDGLVIIPREKILEKVGPLPIEVISGVGVQMKHKLNLKGYFIVSDLLKISEQELKKHWGNIAGLRIAKELRGEDLLWRAESVQKSLSHQHVLPPQLRNFESSYQILLKLLMRGATRLRDERFKAGKLSIAVKFMDGSYFENSVSFQPTFETFVLAENLQKIWHNQKNKKTIKVSVTLGDLAHGPEQMSFFDSPKNSKLDVALDAINNRFGKNTLFLANTKDVLSFGKTKISFNHIPSADDEFEILE